MPLLAHRYNAANAEVFTDMPLYWARYSKPSGSGSANADITTWSTKTGTTAGQADFNTTTGVWTCSIAGWYLMEAFGYNASASNNYQIHVYIDRGVGYAWEGFIRGIHYQASSPPGSWKGSAPMAGIRYFDVGDKVKLYQFGGLFQEGIWSVVGLYSSGGFYAQKATGTGSRTVQHTVDGYDSVTTFGNGFSFSTSTGLATITRAGRWVIGGKGSDIGYNPATEAVHAFIEVNGAVQDGGSYVSKAKVATNGSVRQWVADLSNGDTIGLQDRGALGDCEFWAFKLHDDAHWFAAHDKGSGSAAAGIGYYTGWAAANAGGASFNTTSGLATTARAGVWNTFAGAFESPSNVYNNVNYEFRYNGGLVGDQWYHVQDSITTYSRNMTNSGLLCGSIGSSQTMGLYAGTSGNSGQWGTFVGWEVRGNDS